MGKLGLNPATLPAKIPALPRGARRRRAGPGRDAVRFPPAPQPPTPVAVAAPGAAASGAEAARVQPRARRAPRFSGVPPRPAFAPHPGAAVSCSSEPGAPGRSSPPALRAAASRSHPGRAARGWAARRPCPQAAPARRGVGRGGAYGRAPPTGGGTWEASAPRRTQRLPGARGPLTSTRWIT